MKPVPKPVTKPSAGKPATTRKGRPPKNLNMIGQQSILSFLENSKQKVMRGPQLSSQVINSGAQVTSLLTTLVGTKRTEAENFTGEKKNTAA